MAELLFKNAIPDLVKQIESGFITSYINKFDEECAKTFFNDLRNATNLGQKIFPVFINSYGGQVDALASMIDNMASFPHQIATIASGKAMSCGSVLLACGSPGLRFASPNSRIMVHNVSSGTFGKAPEMEADVEETKRLQKQIFQLMAQRCGQPKNYFLDLIKSKGNVDIFMTPEEALKHKIVDAIKVPKFKVEVDIGFSLK